MALNFTDWLAKWLEIDGWIGLDIFTEFRATERGRRVVACMHTKRKMFGMAMVYPCPNLPIAFDLQAKPSQAMKWNRFSELITPKSANEII